MRKTLINIVILISGLSGLTPSVYAQSVEQWVVVLNDPRPARLQGWQSSNYRGESGHYNSAIELKRVGSRIAKRYGLALKNEWFVENLSVYCLIVEFNGDREQTLARLKRDKRVKWVQPSNEFELLRKAAVDRVSTSVVRSASDNTDLSNIPDWVNGNGVEIAIIDSAVDKSHMDLSSTVQRTVDFVLAGENHSQTGEAHGTAIAAVLVAQPQGNIGLEGIAPAAKLTAFRGCWEEGAGDTRCNTLSLARALDAVASSKPNILNLSLSGPRDRLLDGLIDKIVMNNTLVVAAFDPQRPQSQRFPTRQDGVLIVRAETLDEEHQNEFTAPGGRLVASPGNRYDYITGHSIAAAYTTGVLALIAQVDRGRLRNDFGAIRSQFGKRRFQKVSDLVARLHQITNLKGSASRISNNQVSLVH